MTVENVIRLGVTAVLGGIGAAAGFRHTHDWAAANGQHGWLAWSVAVVIEGMAVVAGFEIRRDHHRGYHRKLTFPMLVLITGCGIQMAAQVALAPPTPAGWLLAAIPALGFLVVVKLLLRSPRTTAATNSPPAPAPAPAPPTSTAVERSPIGTRLPAAMREALADTARRAAAEGRAVTADDVRTAVRVSPHIAEQLATDLAAHRPVNGHPVTPS